MDERILKWLYDIKLCIDEIDSFFKEEEKDFFKYRNNVMLKRAVERNLEIIGEATNRILALKPDIAITSARKIVDTRNRISHGYDSVSDEIVWAIIIRDLPLLKEEVEKLLS